MAQVRGTGRKRGTPVGVGDDVSDAQKNIFFKHLNEDFDPSVSEAAKAARITKKQLDGLMRGDEAFLARYREWQGTQLDDVLDSLIRRAKSGDPSAARFVLEKLRPDQFGAKGKLDITHTIRSFEDLQHLTDEELDEMMGGGK